MIAVFCEVPGTAQNRSHRRGHWFDPSIAHSTKRLVRAGFRRRITGPLAISEPPHESPVSHEPSILPAELAQTGPRQR